MGLRWTGEELLARLVRLRGIQLGRAIDLLVEPGVPQLIGFEVRCGDDVVRFLPFAATRIRDDELEVRSALLLLDENDTSFYRRRTRPLSELRGLPVSRDGTPTGTLAEIVVGEDGRVVELILEGGGRVPAGPSVQLSGQASAA